MRSAEALPPFRWVAGSAEALPLAGCPVCALRAEDDEPESSESLVASLADACVVLLGEGEPAVVVPLEEEVSLAVDPAELDWLDDSLTGRARPPASSSSSSPPQATSATARSVIAAVAAMIRHICIGIRMWDSFTRRVSAD